MLNIQQIEALRKANPQLYEALKRLAGASLGPNQGWSLDNQITDGANFARVSSSALTSNQIDPTKSGVLMRGSVPPTWSGAFTYVSTTSSLTWSWSGLSIYRADGTTTAIPNGSVAVTGLTAATTYYFYPYWDETAGALAWVAAGAGSPAYAQSAKTNLAAQQPGASGTYPALARRDRGGDHKQRHRRRIRRRQRELSARGHDGAHARARHRAHRNVQGWRTSPLPVGTCCEPQPPQFAQSKRACRAEARYGERRRGRE